MRMVVALLTLCSCLLANGTLDVAGPVRITAHRVRARLHDRVAEVAVEHTFHSDADRRLEGSYVFPLPEGATVSEFAMTMGGKLVHGEVMEKGKARRIYEDIVARKKDPGLLEKVARGVFRARVFPIEPRSDLTIRVVYQQLLPESDGTIELRYPLARDRMKVRGVETVSIEVEMESSADLRTVYSPSHEIEVIRKGPRAARVGWEGGRTAQGKDFLLYLGRSAEAVAFSLVSHKAPAEPGTFLAILAPVPEAKDDAILSKDVIYVLDTSGSMRGKKLAQAQAALKAGVERLRPGDRFNVIAFSTEARTYRDRLVPAEARTKRAAREWIARLGASGGTALDEALQAAMAQPEEDRLAIVVLLTDGLPSVGEQDPSRIVARVTKANRAKARVFVFGVGFDQNVAFLDRIATLTRGSREYITPEQDLEIVVSRFFKRIDQPVLSDLALDLGGGVSEVYPKRLPDLFAGDQLVVLGRYAKPGARPIRLQGTLHGKRVTYRYEGTLVEDKIVTPLPRIWAERKVEYLLEQIRVNGNDRELIDEVVRLGKKHSIVTPYTSGLVVEDEEVAGVPEAAFEGPSTNTSIGLGGGAGGRRARGGKRNLRSGGGSGLTENATEKGLFWLARRQAVDTTGSWGDPETTAWSLLAYLGAGYTDRGSRRENKHARTVRVGLQALIAAQREDGSFGRGDAGDAVATMALCEAYWMTRNPRYKRPAQRGLDRLARSRRAGAGWGNDVLATVHAILALRSGKHAGLEVDPDALEGARVSLAGATLRSDAERAGALLARIVLGEDPRVSRELQAMAASLRAPKGGDLALLQLGTMAMFQFGRAPWHRWNREMKEIVVESQQPDGSWSAIGNENEVATTAQMSLCLEVYYRYDRVFGIR